MRLRRLLTLPAALLASAAASVACGPSDAEPRAQWVITVATDAPIPSFGDRVLVEVLDSIGGPACAGCTRLFDASTPAQLPLSFGIEASDRVAAVRARLFRASNLGPDGLPKGTALVDAIGRLAPAQGVRNVMLELPARCFGVPADPAIFSVCDPVSRLLVPAPPLGATPSKLPQPGGYLPAARIPCPGPIPEGMVCVPGGLYLMGSFAPIRVGAYADSPERVVRLDPFAMDVDEQRVGTVEALIQQGSVATAPATHNALLNFCTFLGLDEHANDAFPVNCTSWQGASEICAAQGKRLPTEAEWEYAASNAPSEGAYPWGDDADVCNHAYVGRSSFAEGGSIACHDAGTVNDVGPSIDGMPGDLSALGIKNLAGNVAEWVQDDFALYDADCWKYVTFPLENPRCALGGDAQADKALRGGFWSASPFYARAVVRNLSDAKSPSAPAGVRCVKSWGP